MDVAGHSFSPAKTNHKRIIIALCGRHTATPPWADLCWIAALAWSEYGVGANVVSPGPVETPILPDFEATMGREALEAARGSVGRHATVDDVVPVIDEDTAAQLLGQVTAGLTLAQCNNSKRIAMWLAQVGFESDGFKATEEHQKDGRYAPFIGRTWIQITWQANYAAFGQWCKAQNDLDKVKLQPSLRTAFSPCAMFLLVRL